MRVSSGCTRVVLIVGERAYKIAKFRPIVVMGKLRKSLFSRKEFDRLYQKHKKNKMGILVNVLCAGLFANWAEWRYWNQTHDRRCSPSIALWLGGLVLVQRSVESVGESEVLSSPLRSLWYADEEFAKPSQFGRDDDGNIVIVDYATLA
jgi:hypothetical protein